MIEHGKNVNKSGGAQNRSKESEKKEVSKSHMAKGPMGHTAEFSPRL